MLRNLLTQDCKVADRMRDKLDTTEQGARHETTPTPPQSCQRRRRILPLKYQVSKLLFKGSKPRFEL